MNTKNMIIEIIAGAALAVLCLAGVWAVLLALVPPAIWPIR